MLSHDIGTERGRVAVDLDLKIADGVAGIERTENRKKSLHDGATTGQFGETDPELRARGLEIEKAIFCERRGQRFGITVIEAESIAMQGVRNFITVAGQLR